MSAEPPPALSAEAAVCGFHRWPCVLNTYSNRADGAERKEPHRLQLLLGWQRFRQSLGVREQPLEFRFASIAVGNSGAWRLGKVMAGSFR